MFRRKIKGLFQGFMPLGLSLTRKSKHNVKSQIAETKVPDASDRLHGSVGSVASSQVMEFLVIKGLDPETDAIYPQAAQMSHQILGHVVGIGLYGHLG
jgi:hypothetical protein